LDFINARAGLEIGQYFAIQFELQEIVIIAMTCGVGFFVFILVPITYEEILSRLNPRYLITVTVVLNIAAQAVSTVASLLLGFAFKVPTKETTEWVLLSAGGVYGSLITVCFLAVILNKNDDNRKSVLKRMNLKRKLVQGQ